MKKILICSFILFGLLGCEKSGQDILDKTIDKIILIRNDRI